MPLIVCWPGHVPEGEVNHQLVGQTDFLATFAALVGTKLENDAALDSIDLLGTFAGPAVAARESVIQEAISGLLGFRKRDWKYLLTRVLSGLPHGRLGSMWKATWWHNHTA